jgi:hypothetical protein
MSERSHDVTMVNNYVGKAGRLADAGLRRRERMRMAGNGIYMILILNFSRLTSNDRMRSNWPTKVGAVH